MKRASAPGRTASVPAPEAASASGEPKTAPPSGEVKNRRERKTRQPVEELLARAEQMFPGGINTARGKPASLRDIQGALSVGQPRAQQVKAHFRELATR